MTGKTTPPSTRLLLFKTALIHLAIAVSAPLSSHLLTTSAQRLFGGALPVYVYSDLRLYYSYATEAMMGKLPYRDYTIEYPVLSLPFILFPRVLTGSLIGYAAVFVAQMFLVNLITVTLVAHAVGSRDGPQAVRERLFWYTLFLIALGPVVFFKLDFVSAALALAAALAWFSGRARLGGALAALGALAKFFPGLVAGPAFVCEAARARASRLLGSRWFLATAGLGIAIWYFLGGGGLLRVLQHHTGSHLEIEAVTAGMLMAAGKVSGSEMTTFYDRASWRLAAPWSGLAEALAFPVQAALLLLVLWLFVRSGMRSGVRFSGAMILAFVIGSKGLSPQYMIWLLPFVCVLTGGLWQRFRIVFLVCCILTTAIYPWAFAELVELSTPAVALLNVRNALLIRLLGGFLSRSD